ncbi:DEBR0S2_05842g1_1 [Brettanomyces bruxellensis]|uniref:DEBR0S2_05842g1_1 n=1 Tax=Dekkera bruxellensis TaxID=5007 RepID=A0A7D9GYP7_DEKBR|nr:DEBR0S2_05842g1_1 [Brettanomyces bruxellensis]
MTKYIITGVDGFLGGHAADFALDIKTADQQIVLASYDKTHIPAKLVAKAKAAGAEIIDLTYDDMDAMVAVLKGADVVSFVSTWLIGERRRKQHKNVVDACAKAGVTRVCYTSFVGADLDKDIPVLPQDHHYTEQVIFKSGLQYSIQRDCLYLDNTINFFAPSWNYCGAKWLDNSDGVPGAFVSREDCGRTFGALIMGRGKPNTVYTLTGPEALTNKQVFDKICAASGYKGEYVPVSDEELRKYWTAQGVPKDVEGDKSKNKSPMPLIMDDLESCGIVVRRGLMRNVTNDIEKLTGRKPLTAEQTIQSLKDNWPKNE